MRREPLSGAQPITDTQKKLIEDQIEEHRREVRYEVREWPVEVLVQKFLDGIEVDENELFVPDYQRDLTWKTWEQSKFIESVLIGLPIPYLFAADMGDGEDDAGRIEIVDGSQRIRTLAQFVTDELRLQRLEKLTQLEGLVFSDLSIARQRRFRRTTLRMIELEKGTSEEIRRDLFERINTGSDPLTSMEVRRGVRAGKFLSMVEECANDPLFHELAPISPIAVKRKEREEFVLRFFAYLDQRELFEREVREFIDQYHASQEAKVKADASGADEYLASRQAEFRRMLEFAKSYFPFGFKKEPTYKTTPRIRFEALAVGAALALKENPQLVPPPTEEWIVSDTFKTLTTSDASNSRPKLMRRIDFVRDKLLGKVTGA